MSIYPQPLPPPLNIKILLLGESNVGKTSLITRYHQQKFEAQSNLMTIGMDIRRVQRKIDNKDVTLELWDTAGQEKYKNLPNQYFRGIHAILLVYDISDGQSFVRIQDWLDKVSNSTTDKLCLILIGNKKDKEDQREVAISQAQNFANQKNMSLLQTSAKTGEGVEAMFNSIASQVLKKGTFTHHNTVKLRDKVDGAPENNSGCCQ